MSLHKFGKEHTEMHFSQYPALDMEWIKPLVLNNSTKMSPGTFIIWRPLPTV